MKWSVLGLLVVTYLGLPCFGLVKKLKPQDYLTIQSSCDRWILVYLTTWCWNDELIADFISQLKSQMSYEEKDIKVGIIDVHANHSFYAATEFGSTEGFEKIDSAQLFDPPCSYKRKQLDSEYNSVLGYISTFLTNNQRTCMIQQGYLGDTQYSLRHDDILTSCQFWIVFESSGRDQQDHASCFKDYTRLAKRFKVGYKFIFVNKTGDVTDCSATFYGVDKQYPIRFSKDPFSTDSYHFYTLPAFLRDYSSRHQPCADSTVNPVAVADNLNVGFGDYDQFALPSTSIYPPYASNYYTAPATNIHDQYGYGSPQTYLKDANQFGVEPNEDYLPDSYGLNKNNPVTFTKQHGSRGGLFKMPQENVAYERRYSYPSSHPYGAFPSMRGSYAGYPSVRGSSVGYLPVGGSYAGQLPAGGSNVGYPVGISYTPTPYLPFGGNYAGYPSMGGSYPRRPTVSRSRAGYPSAGETSASNPSVGGSYPGYPSVGGSYPGYPSVVGSYPGYLLADAYSTGYPSFGGSFTGYPSAGGRSARTGRTFTSYSSASEPYGGYSSAGGTSGGYSSAGGPYPGYPPAVGTSDDYHSATEPYTGYPPADSSTSGTYADFASTGGTYAGYPSDGSHASYPLTSALYTANPMLGTTYTSYPPVGALHNGYPLASSFYAGYPSDRSLTDKNYQPNQLYIVPAVYTPKALQDANNEPSTSQNGVSSLAGARDPSDVGRQTIVLNHWAPDIHDKKIAENLEKLFTGERKLGPLFNEDETTKASSTSSSKTIRSGARSGSFYSGSRGLFDDALESNTSTTSPLTPSTDASPPALLIVKAPAQVPPVITELPSNDLTGARAVIEQAIVPTVPPTELIEIEIVPTTESILTEASPLQATNSTIILSGARDLEATITDVKKSEQAQGEIVGTSLEPQTTENVTTIAESSADSSSFSAQRSVAQTQIITKTEASVETTTTTPAPTTAPAPTATPKPSGPVLISTDMETVIKDCKFWVILSPGASEEKTAECHAKLSSLIPKYQANYKFGAVQSGAFSISLYLRNKSKPIEITRDEACDLKTIKSVLEANKNESPGEWCVDPEDLQVRRVRPTIVRAGRFFLPPQVLKECSYQIIVRHPKDEEYLHSNCMHEVALAAQAQKWTLKVELVSSPFGIFFGTSNGIIPLPIRSQTECSKPNIEYAVEALIKEKNILPVCVYVLKQPPLNSTWMSHPD